MPKAKTAKKSEEKGTVAKRFPQLAFDKQEQIEDWEAKGWRIFQENGAWQAQHPEIAPVWMPHFESLDGLFKKMDNVVALGRPLTEREQLGVGSDEVPTDLGKAIKKMKMAIVADSVEPDPLGRMIPLALLRPSETNPRKRFPKESITELAASIREHNILEPLIVREQATGYEIVCGERRYRAALEAERKDAPCIVRQLTDDQVLDIQIHENLHREDVHPFDEALGYKFLEEQLGCDNKELALRVGKTESYVQSRLKLNHLTPEWQKEMEEDRLPLTVALEIAKYAPDAQQKFYNDEDAQCEMYGDDWSTIDKHDRGRIVWKAADVATWMSQEVFHDLTKAPFDTSATNLRSDGLACVACPNRTGATPDLFDAKIAKTDSCLDPSCFDGKKSMLIQVTRERLAHEAEVDISEVPRINPTPAHGEGNYDVSLFTDYLLAGKDKQCKSTTYGVSVGTKDFNQALRICLRTSKCPKHWGAEQSAKNGKSAPGKINTGIGKMPVRSERDPAELEQFYKRKEEIWNVKVGEEVRKRVFAFAGVKFAKTFEVTGGGATFLASLCAKLSDLYTNDFTKRRIREMAKSVVAAYMSMDASKLDLSGKYGDGGSGTEKAIAKLPDEAQKLFFFVLIHGHKGDMGNGSWTSQTAVLDIAKEWDLDYREIDALVRKNLSSKKHQQAHDDYYKAVQANTKNAKVPRLYSEKWSPKD